MTRVTHVNVDDALSRRISDVVETGLDVLRAHDRDDDVRLIECKLNPDRQRRCVVVAGEVNRGKSALVNALLGVDDVSPVGDTATTMIPLTITGVADDDRGELVYADRRVPTQPDALRAMVTDTTVDDAPQSAALMTRTGESALLNGVAVIDTPGVGGIDNRLASLAMATADQAAVLVLVCDAGGPITAPEMEFIEKMDSRMDALVVAVTKTDAALQRWRTVVETNQRLIRQRLGRDVPVVGISSLRAAQGHRTTDDVTRARHLARSGMTELADFVNDRLERARQVPVADALYALDKALRSVADRLAADVDALRGGAAATLAAENARLGELRAHHAEWESFLSRDLTIIRDRALDDLDRRLDGLRATCTATISEQGVSVLRSDPRRLAGTISADIHTELAETIAALMTDLHETAVVPRLGADSVAWEHVCEGIAEAVGNRTVPTAPVASRRQGLIDPNMLTMGVVGSSVIGGALGLSALAGVGAALGAVWVTVNLGYRSVRASKHSLLQWLRETLATARVATTRVVDLIIAHAKVEVAASYRRQLARQIEAQRQRVSASSASAQERERRARNLSSNQTMLDRCIADTGSLIEQLQQQGAVR